MIPELSGQTLLVAEWTSVFFNLLFTVLIAYGRRWGWLCGFVGSIIAIGLYAISQTWALSLLQAFFAIMGLYGYWTWGKEETRSIKKQSVSTHLKVIAVGACLVALVAFTLSEYLDGQYPLMDAFITVFSVAATFLMAWKWLNHWYYWIVIDCVWLALNLLIGYNAFVLLSCVYIILSVWGVFKWRKEYSSAAQSG